MDRQTYKWRKALSLLTFGFFSLSLGVSVLGIDPIFEIAWLKCPLKALTGIACPTCGLGHSLLALSAGQFAESLRYHPLGALMALSLIILTTLSYAHQPAFQSVLKIGNRRMPAILMLTVTASFLWKLCGA